MLAKRNERQDDSNAQNEFPNLASSEMLRIAAPRHDGSMPHHPAPTEAKGEDKWVAFWKICGATVLSITALVIITAYTQLASSINELRAELNRTNLASTDLVKNEDFKARNTSMWNKIQELQTLNVALTSLTERLKASEELQKHLQMSDREVAATVQNGLAHAKDRLSILDERVRASEADHKLLQEVQLIATSTKERLAAAEQGLKIVDHIQKELQNIHTSISNVQGAAAERKSIRDEQMKLADEDRKEMMKEVRSFSERLSKLEGQLESRNKPAPAPKTGSSSKPVNHETESE